MEMDPSDPIKTHPHIYTTTTAENQEYQEGNFTDGNNKTNGVYSALKPEPEDEAREQYKAERSKSDEENSSYKKNIHYGYKPSTSMPYSWFLSILLTHLRKLRFISVSH